MAAAEKRLRVGLIGLGGVALSHAEAYRSAQGIELVAGADPAAARRALFTTRFGLRTYESAEDLFRHETLGIACVLTPVNTHRAVTELAAEQGAHVLCEKPLALTLEDARAMLDTCERAGVKVFYGSTYRFLPAVAKARELIAAGMIGEPRLFIENAVGGRGLAGHQPMGFSHYPPGGPGGGGMGLVDHGIHLIDIFQWLAGQRVTAVFGRGNISGAPPRPEFLVMLMDGGAVGHLINDDATFGTELPGEGAFSWGAAWDMAGEPMPARTWHAQPGSIRVHGTEGALRILHYANQLFLTTAAGQVQVPVLDRPAPDHFALQMEAFVRNIVNGEEPATPAVDGVRALEVLLAAYESEASGRVVTVGPGPA